MAVFKYSTKGPNLGIAPISYDSQSINLTNTQLRIYFNTLDKVTAQLDNVLNSNTGGTAINFPYGAFEDSTTQTAPANTAKLISFNTTDYSNGVSLGSRTVTFTGSRTLTTLTVSGSVGTIYLGMALTGSGVPPNTFITAFLTGTGGDGTYTTSTSGTIASTTINGSITSKIIVANAGIYNYQFSLQSENTDTALHDMNIWTAQNGVYIPGSNGLVSVPNSHGGVNGHSVQGWNQMIKMAAGDYIEQYWSTDSVLVTIPYYAAGTGPVRPSTPSIAVSLSFVSSIPV